MNDRDKRLNALEWIVITVGAGIIVGCCISGCALHIHYAERHYHGQQPKAEQLADQLIEEARNVQETDGE